ncbi:MAG: hypothetical protein GXP31_00660 [Kiritimatiellaeota bacterium]|nr:hypothetical protein [Kiritimatiellota bacterium]
MKHWAVLGCILAYAFCLTGARGAGPAVRKADAAEWRLRVIPLPKRIDVRRQVTLRAADVGVRLRAGAGDIENTAANELRELFRENAGRPPTGKKFVVLMGVATPDGRLEEMRIPEVARLKRLPNSDQAYLIRPVGRDRLVLTALTPQGVYYAAQTLRQLIDSRFEDGSVTLPLVSVTDWPDLAERGEWGGSADKDIVWMAHLKMNLVESHARLGLTPAGKGTAHADPARIQRGRLHALKVVPIITHLDQLGRTGVYERFPELKGKGPSAVNPSSSAVQAPCCSQPELGDLLADWMRDLSAQRDVTDVCAWLSENRVACSCDRCRATGLPQHALEARCLVRAWKQVSNQHPNLRLRILLTQGSYAGNSKVLAEVPPEVGITYYDGGRTYDSSRDPMIYPLLEDYAAKGGWLGCYPQLTASWRIVCPWSAPQFIRFRMTEFVDKGLACLCGYATPNNRLYEFNVTAAAEWAWNAHGRDEREFALAYFTRKGVKDPAAAADWAVMLGPVGWDVYGSRAYNAFFGEAAAMIAGRRRAGLGKGMYRYFPTVDRIENDLEVCRRAATIARRLEDPLILLETKVVQGYVTMLDAIRRLADRLADTRGTFSAHGRTELQKEFGRLALSGMRVSRALDEWERACGSGKRIGGGRLRDTVDVTQKTVADIAATLASLGVVDPLQPYRPIEIGGWSTHDFDRKTKLQKRYEVTRFVTKPGAWSVTFQYTSGWWGLSVERVALAATPADRPGKLRELAVDKHHGSTGARSKDNTYTLEVKKLPEHSRLFVVADIRGVKSVGRPENRRGCNGKVSLMAALPEDWETALAGVRPLTDAELRERERPRFHGKGVRVGVLEGGYGAEAVLNTLRKAQDVDAVPLRLLLAETLKPCQVVIVPQPRAPLGGAAVKLLEAFVRSGGGLVTTHNAVGYRGHPPILPEICAKGVDHVRDPHWTAVRAAPLTAGIPAGKPLAQTYYDHIELAPGPKGAIAAKATKSGKPVVVYGAAGKGRYVACGLALGLATDTREQAPGKAERTLLLNSVRWCAGRRARTRMP